MKWSESKGSEQNDNKNKTKTTQKAMEIMAVRNSRTGMSINIEANKF